MEQFFRSCEKECEVPVESQIEGVIPEWVNGTLLRNGPGLKEINGHKYEHLFDGLALLHRFQINDGKVFYSNKFLRSDAYEKVMKAQKIVVSDFGTRALPDPCKSIFRRYLSYFSLHQLEDNCSVSFCVAGDDVYAVTETPYFRKIDPHNLDTGEKVDFSNFVNINLQTAHPHKDEDGTLYNLCSRFGPILKYCITKIPNSDLEKASILCKIPKSNSFYPSYSHSFCMTQNYIVFIEQPLVFSVPSLIFKQAFGVCPAKAMIWNPVQKTRFYVISKDFGKVLKTTYVSAPFAFFHTINAYEDGNCIICDICCYDDGNVIKASYRQSLQKLQNTINTSGENGYHQSNHGKHFVSQVRRFALPLGVNQRDSGNLVKVSGCSAKAFLRQRVVSLEYETLTQKGINMGEMPNINNDFDGKKYRYFYSWGTKAADLSTNIIKVDVLTKKVLTWSLNDFCPSEPIFVKRLDSEDEDDGVILSSVLSLKVENEGFLLMLDAKTFDVIAKAHFKTPSSIPKDFHGLFLSAQNMNL